MNRPKRGFCIYNLSKLSKSKIKPILSLLNTNMYNYTTKAYKAVKSTLKSQIKGFLKVCAYTYARMHIQSKNCEFRESQESQEE